MLNKEFRIIWLRVRTEKGRGFHLFLPISLAVFRELLDSFLDTAELICVFAPDKSRSGSRLSARTIKELAEMLLELFGSLTDEGPYDLVEVSADGVEVSITVR